MSEQRANEIERMVAERLHAFDCKTVAEYQWPLQYLGLGELVKAAEDLIATDKKLGVLHQRLTAALWKFWKELEQP